MILLLIELLRIYCTTRITRVLVSKAMQDVYPLNAYRLTRLHHPAPPKESLFKGPVVSIGWCIWDILKGSWGVLDHPGLAHAFGYCATMKPFPSPLTQTA